MLKHVLKVISLNIEQDSHFDRFIPFILKESPDVLLVQEIIKTDLPYLEKTFGMQSSFVALNYLHHNNAILELGLATFSKLPYLKTTHSYYRHDGNGLPTIYQGEPEKMARAVLVTEIMKENYPYCLINTHFTWSPHGKPNDQQVVDLEKLFSLLENNPEFILAGDFNAPRGTFIFDSIAKKYQDNIPKEITTTIDKNLHKAGALKLVVDGLFTTPQFKVHDIKIVDNVSDHCAIVATIQSQDAGISK